MAQLDFENLASGTLVLCCGVQTIHRLTGATATTPLKELWGENPGDLWHQVKAVEHIHETIAVFLEYYSQSNVGWVKLLHPDLGPVIIATYARELDVYVTGIE